MLWTRSILIQKALRRRLAKPWRGLRKSKTHFIDIARAWNRLGQKKSWIEAKQSDSESLKTDLSLVRALLWTLSAKSWAIPSKRPLSIRSELPGRKSAGIGWKSCMPKRVSGIEIKSGRQ